MLSFRAELLTQLHPESLEGVVGNLISPKGIKKKKLKGIEFFTDFTDPEEEEVVPEGGKSEMIDTDTSPHAIVNKTNTVNLTPFTLLFIKVPFHFKLLWTIQTLTKTLNSWMTCLASSVMQKQAPFSCRTRKNSAKLWLMQAKVFERQSKTSNEHTVAVLCQRHDFILLYHFFHFFNFLIINFTSFWSCNWPENFPHHVFFRHHAN